MLIKLIGTRISVMCLIAKIWNDMTHHIEQHSLIPVTSGRNRRGFLVVCFVNTSGACNEARTRSLSSTARLPSRRSL